MAADKPLSPRPIYNSPTASGIGRPRQNSRMSSHCSTPLPPSMESPRTLCPRDSDTFTWKTHHLPYWYLPTGLWDRLPPSFKKVVIDLQKAGAGVLTGLERLEEHSADIDIGPNSDVKEDEMLVQLDDSCSSSIDSLMRSLPPLNTKSSMSSSAVMSSPASGSQSPETMTTCTSQASQVSPVSPMSLAADAFPDALIPPSYGRIRERSFSTPLEPHNAKYVYELSQLRTEAVPRMRHKAREVDSELKAAERDGTMSASDLNELNNWWAEKKCKTVDLETECMRLSHAIGLSPNGIGWTAP